MRTDQQFKMSIRNKRLVAIVFTVMLLLLIPFIAMQFTNEVKWTGFDFLVAGILLLTTALLCELVIRKVKKASTRVLLCLVILVVLLLIWIELAVGIFGSPFAGN